jgi:uracil-DNA glycosylase
MTNADRQALIAALQWHIDAGADEAYADVPNDLTILKALFPPGGGLGEGDINAQAASTPSPSAFSSPSRQPSPQGERESVAGTSTLKLDAIKLARAANTLDELKAAIAAFDGIGLKKTATNLVFCDGNPASPVMLVGEAPGADEDAQGKPFVGVSGQLLDRILKTIGLDRADATPEKSLYISNILNWRPPGNRTPTPAEIELSLPFIERHIALARPKILIFCGGVSAKALLGSGLPLSKLRGRWHDYRPRTADIGGEKTIPALATYHPVYLLQTPAQKRAVWQDMLVIQQKLRTLGIPKDD